MNIDQEIFKSLDLTSGDIWYNRHMLPSINAGFVIPMKYMKRKSILRSLCNQVIVKSTLIFPKMYYDIKDKRYIDSVMDWESIGKLDDRNDYLKGIAVGSNQKNVATIIDKNKTKMIILPSDLDGYTCLDSDEREFLKLILIYSKIPTEEDISKDLMLINGVGEAKAKDLQIQGIKLVESLLDTGVHVIFNYRVNRNQVDILFAFLRKIEREYERKIPLTNKKNMLLVGSFGRGRIEGHDIDLLVHERIYEDIIKIFNSLSYRIILCDKSWAVYLYDILVRIDINVFTDKDKITKKLHYEGPKNFNIWLRKEAKKIGFKLNQDGLVKNGIVCHPKTEQELFKKLSLDKDRLDFWLNYKRSE